MESSLGARQTITRNALGDVVGMIAKQGAQRWEAAIVRDALGLEVDRQLPGGVRSYWWRDAVGRPTQHFVGKERQLVRARRYAWGVDDRITAIAEEGVGELRFQHDARGTLVATTRPSGHVDVRASDEVGNLFRTAARDDREYGPTGELRKERTPEGVRTYRYDAEGNLVRREDPDGAVWTYAWDGAGRLRTVTTPAGDAVTFDYDPLGRRVRKTAREETTTWIWDGDVLLHELRERDASAPADAAPQPTTWIFDPDRFAPAARLDADTALSVVTDHLGTPLCLLDEHGAARWQGSLDAWGTDRVAGDAALCPWRFPGQYEDAETGLYYNRFRYYDAGLGGYVSIDPLGLTGGPALRGYVQDPLTWVDVHGLSKRTDYGSASDPEITFRNPFDVHFSHPVRRASKFSNPSHGTVADLAAALRANPSLATTIPPIHVLPDGGKLYSANNRRLLAFREAQVEVPTVPASRTEATKILRRTRKLG